MQTLVFHSYAGKRAFVRQNLISDSEIVAETDGTITLTHKCSASADFENNVHVYYATDRIFGKVKRDESFLIK